MSVCKPSRLIGPERPAPLHPMPQGEPPDGAKRDDGTIYRAAWPTVPVYGRRGKLPPVEGEREYRCGCNKLIIRGYMPPGSRIEGWCRECKMHVVFEA